MKFWDSSAILPLIAEERTSVAMTALFNEDREIVLAWITPIEINGAIWRRWRETGEDIERNRAETVVSRLKSSWIAVTDIDPVATRASELFSRHALKAADAIQLASALVAAEDLGNLPFVTLDLRLATAARAEGLTVLP